MSGNAMFSAPWGSNLKLMTWAICIALFAFPIAILISMPSQPLWWVHLIIPFGVLLVFSLFTIRGYGIDRDTLYIYRLCWKTRIDLDLLLSVEYNPEALFGSIRAFGNGGLFCISGDFYNKRIGSFRMFATDKNNAVVMRFPKQAIVVTPGDPEGFVRYVKEMKGWE